jgi:hypothetical protein
MNRRANIQNEIEQLQSEIADRRSKIEKLQSAQVQNKIVQYVFTDRTTTGELNNLPRYNGIDDNEEELRVGEAVWVEMVHRGGYRRGLIFNTFGLPIEQHVGYTGPLGRLTR